MGDMQTVVVYQKGTNEVIACVPLDGSECIVRKDAEIKVYDGTEPVFTEKDGYVAVNTNAFFMDFGKGD